MPRTGGANRQKSKVLKMKIGMEWAKANAIDDAFAGQLVPDFSFHAGYLAAP
jgi:hypothetical protein